MSKVKNQFQEDIEYAAGIISLDYDHELPWGVCLSLAKEMIISNNVQDDRLQPGDLK